MSDDNIKRKIEGNPVFPNTIDTYDRDGGVLVVYRVWIHRKGVCLCGTIPIAKKYHTNSHAEALSLFLSSYMPFGEWYSKRLGPRNPKDHIEWERVSNWVACPTFNVVILENMQIMQEFSIGSTLYRGKF